MDLQEASLEHNALFLKKEELRKKYEAKKLAHQEASQRCGALISINAELEDENESLKTEIEALKNEVKEARRTHEESKKASGVLKDHNQSLKKEIEYLRPLAKESESLKREIKTMKDMAASWEKERLASEANLLVLEQQRDYWKARAEGESEPAAKRKGQGNEEDNPASKKQAAKELTVVDMMRTG